MLAAYSLAGMMALQLVVSLAQGNNSAKRTQQATGGGAMPGGRSPGSISAIYSGLD